LVSLGYVFSATEILLNSISNIKHGVPTLPTRVADMDIAICQICKEPIWSFICPDCLARDIAKWLPKKLSTAFSTFHKDFTSHFQGFFSETKLQCIHCKQLKTASICPFCYIDETLSWLKEKNSDLASRLVKLVSNTRTSTGFQPVTEFRLEEPEEGICEYCGMFSHELVLKNGNWICRECEEFER
jgi:hypothetical protein